jgi:cold shock CspA family protein/ribosome-associated translation inhibitor RaiA
MQVPIEITFRDVPSNEAIRALVEEQARRLDRFCENLTSCRVAIEHPQRHQRSGNPYRVRIELTLPPRKDLVVVQEPQDNEMHLGLPAIVRRAFRTMERQLKDMTEVRRGDVKSHPEPRAVVMRLFADHGFLRALDGSELYFHRNAVLHGAFDRLTVGAEVRFEAVAGEDGPQASTVQMVNPVGMREVTERTPPPSPPARRRAARRREPRQ